MPVARTAESAAAVDSAKHPALDAAPQRPVVGEEQDVLRTRSRRAEPRAWLRAVVWLAGSGLHPRVGPTTVVVARDLAARMDFRRGIVVYGLAGVTERTGLSEATVKRHVQVLRELGALVWMVHGSKRNLALPGEAYMATATIYGAVIPQAFDDAMGHRLDGTGYEARVCGVTPAGRELAVVASGARSDARRKQSHRTGRCEQAVRRGGHPVDNPAVDNSCSSGREPHSPGSYHRQPAVDVETGCKDTSRERASRSTTSPSAHKVSGNSPGGRRTARQVQRGIWITRQVRARVQWTQRVRLRRLEFVLRPWIDAGLDADTIAAELHSWMLTWRPARPAEYIRAQLAQQTAAEHVAAEFEAAEGWDEQEASGALTASRPDLVRSVLDGLAVGLAAYSAVQAERGLDDLTDRDAAADIAAFLGTTTATGVRYE
ncbi:cell wall protein (plasmid) [Streptomyces finlayi]|uniref:Cell wall protein n=1 Tax=Streptomyces finlayi TaxID=67296 RepID=A0A7G7BW69_9ACTN|nr:cell wall protein [Streptomyces finlayi]QNE79584.1 cell wall protein [Streptomyces finlayi]